jgi:hypothetical protein
VNDASPEEIDAAMNAGELVEYLDSPLDHPVIGQTPRDGQRSESCLRAATPEQVESARAAGELDDFMGIIRNEAGNIVDAMGRM